ncbi:MAG: cation:proton antiporter [Dehalococcoidia bacterium]
MEDLGLVGDLAVVATAALIGGGLARALRLPPMLGYLAAGVFIGPHTPGPSSDIDDVQAVADLGVALLMFTLGVQFSLRELAKMRSIAFAGGIVTAVVMLGAGILAGLALSLSTEEAIVAGMALGISSTMVALRLLEDRGMVGALPGRIAIAISLAQDLLVVVFIVMIPVVGGEGDSFLRELGLAGLKAIAVLAGVAVIGVIAVPRLLALITRSRSRELFLLTVVALALGTASISFTAGLSLAFGAFLAGLIISESEYAHQTLAEVFPLREVFAVVFFVGIGMLINPDAFVDHPEIIIVMVLLSLALRPALITGASVALALPLRAALPAAVALGAMGEFSFVLLSEAGEEGITSGETAEALLAAVVVSMAISPVMFLGQDRVMRWVSSLSPVQSAMAARVEVYTNADERLANHAIVVGYEAAGREVTEALRARGFRYVVIDHDPLRIRQLAADGVSAILGDAAVPAILQHAGVERARVMVVTLTDPGHVEAILAAARSRNRRLDVVARGAGEEALARLSELGVSQVVAAEFEVGMQFVRHTLHRFGLSSQEIQAIVARRRRDVLG